MTDRELTGPRPPWAARRARRKARAKARVSQGVGRWIFPALALAAPLAGEAADGYLLACLLFGAIVALWGAHRTGAVWPILAWSLVTGVFAGVLVLVEVPALPDLTLIALAAATAQALALLAIGAPATIEGWGARGMVLVSLAGPAALALLTLQGAPAWGAFAAAVAVSLDLAGLPLALLARRRVRP
jgi:hypothetical protein